MTPSAISLAVFSGCLLVSAHAFAVEAKFIDGAYTMNPQACAKLRAIAKGGPRNVSSVPWSVSSKGFDHGEGGCALLTVTQRKKGREWAISALCVTHGSDTSERDTYVFTRSGPKTFSVKLTTPGTPLARTKAVTYTRCDTAKGA